MSPRRTVRPLPAADGRGVIVVVCRKHLRDTVTLNAKDEAALQAALDAVGGRGQVRAEGTL